MFKIFLLLILILRILLFLLPSFQTDMGSWEAWSARLVHTGPSGFYSQTYFSDYFPGYLYILWIAGSIFNFLSMPISGIYFEFFLKSITTLFDIGSAFYIYKIVINYNKSWAYLAPILYLLNPAIIFNTSIWGQIDGIFTFFIVLSSYFLIEKKEIFKSSLAATLGVLVKPHALVIVPVLLINSFNNFSSLKFIKSLIVSLFTLILLSVPFFPNNPILGIFELGIKSQDVYKFTSLFAFNFWAIIGWWKPDNTLFIVSYKMWGIIMFAISILLIAFPLFKKKEDSRQFYFASALSFLSFFLFLTRMHERYLFPFLALFLIIAIIKKSKFLLILYFIISTVHFINLLFVYYYFNFVYNSLKFTDNFLYMFYVFVNNNYKFFPVILLGSFFVILFKYYKSIYVEKS